ncbi:MAG: CinA family protein [Peptococcaceae bacterium]|nr:CinA family protein [Peptococcaceae bacterium]
MKLLYSDLHIYATLFTKERIKKMQISPIVLIFNNTHEKNAFFQNSASHSILNIAPVNVHYARTIEEFFKVLNDCTNDFYCRTIIAIGKVFYNLNHKFLQEKSSYPIESPSFSRSKSFSKKYFRLNTTTHLFITTSDHILEFLPDIKQYYSLIDDQTLYQQSNKIGNILKQKNLTIATAESCSGGLICKSLTDIAGSSKYVCGGACTYTVDAKQNILLVSKKIIDSFGVVSHETAKAMALGAQKLYNSNIGVSTTGVAGPGADDQNNPEGLVYVGLAINNLSFSYKYSASMYTYLLDRDVIRKSCVLFILKKLEEQLNII